MDKIIKPSTQKILKSLYKSFIPVFNTETRIIEDPKRYQQKMHRITITNEVYYKAEYYVNGKKIKDCFWSKDQLKSNLNTYKDCKLDINKSDKESKSSESNEVINKINEVLDTKIRPAVAKDGGDIRFKSFKDGIVVVELKGSCSGCPSSIMTLKQGVQNLMCHYIPEVKKVEAS